MDAPNDVWKNIERMLGPAFEVLEVRVVSVNVFAGKVLHRKRRKVYKFKYYLFDAKAKGPLLELKA